MVALFFPSQKQICWFTFCIPKCWTIAELLKTEVSRFEETWLAILNKNNKILRLFGQWTCKYWYRAGQAKRMVFLPLVPFKKAALLNNGKTLWKRFGFPTAKGFRLFMICLFMVCRRMNDARTICWFVRGKFLRPAKANHSSIVNAQNSWGKMLTSTCLFKPFG